MFLGLTGILCLCVIGIIRFSLLSGLICAFVVGGFAFGFCGLNRDLLLVYGFRGLLLVSGWYFWFGVCD